MEFSYHSSFQSSKILFKEKAQVDFKIIPLKSFFYLTIISEVVIQMEFSNKTAIHLQACFCDIKGNRN